jgi:hypothetical protein
MQLVAYGAQDVYLTGSPSITFWKLVYRRHTSFALETIEQVFNGQVGWGRRFSSTISRNGDLVTTGYLEITLKRNTTNDVLVDEPFYPAEAVVKNIEIEVGGQKLDSMTSDFYRIYDELMRTGDEKEGYRRMTNFDSGAPDGQVRRFYLPLLFFFNTNPGLALPLIALQYHECKIHVTFAPASEMSKLGVDTTEEPTCALWLQYVFLDAEERRRFAQTSHEYLITQVQHTGPESVAPDTGSKRTSNIRLNFNHPCKYLVFAAKHPDIHGKFTTSTNLQEYNDAYAPVHEIKASFNGHDRNAVKRGSWHNQVVPYETIKSRPSAGIYLYSFCLRPQEHQPSGTANFSRIDNAQLTLTFKQGTAAGIANVKSEDSTLSSVTGLSQLLIYACSYNVLRVMSGMAGLSYCN